jgi:hypothetical protein
MEVMFTPVATNTGASTLNISALGDLNLLSVSGDPLLAGELVAGQTYRATYNGTNLRLNAITKRYADNLALNTALPAQVLGFLRSQGPNTASFGTQHTGYAHDEVRGADIPSTGTINLQTATGNLVHVTGTTAITAVTLNSGAEREVIFDGILTLTNSANLILPTAANITTAVGDAATFRGEPAGAVRVTKYQPANGRALAVAPLGDHEVVVNNGAGLGSTNSAIRRFGTLQSSVGTAITYASSATLGDSFTVNETGIYAITYVDLETTGSGFGISVNSNQLTTGASNITATTRVAFARPTGGAAASTTAVVKLTSGDVVRAHAAPGGTYTNSAADNAFRIKKIGGL